MTRQPDFTGVWMKVERAKHHFGDLQVRYERFRETNPYEATPYDEPDTGDLVYKAKVPKQPPLWWSTVTGDCVHNLRSSLDLLVCEMVRSRDKPVTDKTGFPIAKSPDAFESGYIRKVKGAPQVAVEFIKASKPYQGADNPFWRLHKLDIADKHNLLVPIGIAHQRTTTTLNLDQFFAANPGVTEVTGAEVVNPPQASSCSGIRFLWKMAQKSTESRPVSATTR
jgi:hypothetical protein